MGQSIITVYRWLLNEQRFEGISSTNPPDNLASYIIKELFDKLLEQTPKEKGLRFVSNYVDNLDKGFRHHSTTGWKDPDSRGLSAYSEGVSIARKINSGETKDHLLTILNVLSGELSALAAYSDAPLAGFLVKELRAYQKRASNNENRVVKSISELGLPPPYKFGLMSAVCDTEKECKWVVEGLVRYLKSNEEMTNELLNAEIINKKVVKGLTKKYEIKTDLPKQVILYTLIYDFTNAAIAFRQENGISKNPQYIWATPLSGEKLEKIIEPILNKVNFIKSYK